ncbi:MULTISPECIES: Bax inhibitor-1/YccA family protein [Barnesiella]|uniref:Bax inhibitor-1/YccA family protein n=1 Tax=Barnesiella TaxID=397864 RepID=UPI0021AD1316|nr:MULTISPECIES: Bax inhibitor-1/YccA family protein [Barnesiella]MCR8910967.1 Bax inhibitor-1/YccA family protein [Barnesiella sp. ET7]MDM8268405.1 Bax inhibitor-1/YccA family protein [Barnesiella viscericola]
MENSYDSYKSTATSSVLSTVMRKVYVRMFLALVVTAFTALYVASSPALLTTILGSRAIFFGLMIAELAVVFVLSGMLHKLSTATATLLFYLYAILNGVVFSSIFVVYELGSIAYTFFITAGVFGAMSVYGLVTKNDMTRFGSYCVMALFGLIIATVVNIFVASSTLDWIISFVGVALFIGLTAWDTQKIKNAAYEVEPSQMGKLATIGALSLYLDFINLFLYLLRFFGRSND